MPDDRFNKVEQEYRRLRVQLDAKQLTHEQFEAALRPLMFQDAQGRYWMIGVDSGQWHVYDGQQWLASRPPQTAEFVVPNTAGAPPAPAQPSKAQLVIMRGSANRQSAPLEVDAVTIGRALSNTLVLNDAQASRLHARVDFENGAWSLKDLNSRNGTFVNGIRVTQQALRPGDQIVVGETLMVFQISGG
jgi:Inner membrane component of T3SS, cytoplasmic domain